MINWLKTLWKDLGNLSKPQFFQKYILPGLALFFTWGIVGHIMLINLNTNSLIKNTGQVTDIGVKLDQGPKYKYYPLKIALIDYSNEFRLSDTYKGDFTYLQQKISIGDTVTLYTRRKWQSLLGWGKQIDIYQIDKGGQTLFGISKVIEEKKSQLTLFSVFCLILWPWYFIYRRTRHDDWQGSRQQRIAASVAGRNSIWLTNNTASNYLYSTALLPMPHQQQCFYVIGKFVPCEHF